MNFKYFNSLLSIYIQSIELIITMPLIVLIITSIILLIAIIIWKRNNLVGIFSLIGLSIAIWSIFFYKFTSNQPDFVTTILYIDNYSLLISVLVLLASLITSIFTYLWLYFFALEDQGEIFLLILIATVGGVLLANTNNLSSFFIGIELMAVPLFGLTGYTFNRITYLESSIKYTLLSAITSSFLLFGIALIYAQTGYLTYSQISIFINNNIQSPLLLLGFGLIMTSIGFKLSLVPFHQWTAEIYEKSPFPAVWFLATSSKIAIFGATTRLLVNLHLIDNKMVYILLSIMAFISILVGNFMALFQLNIKRLLAYSSISHFGYLWIALICAHTNKFFSLETINISLVSYLLSSLGLLGIIMLISTLNHKNNSIIDDINSYRGLFLHHPILSLAMTIMILSLSGIPLTLGFLSKFYLLILSIMSHQWWLTFSILIGTIIGLYYYLRLIAYLYLSLPTEKIILFSSKENLVWFWYIGAILVGIIAILICILGIIPQYIINCIQFSY
ncbi:MAG: NADH-quinone oxidoreductase subunit N [Candidatus Dasytiphilus stammeri]